MRSCPQWEMILLIQDTETKQTSSVQFLLLFAKFAYERVSGGVAKFIRSELHFFYILLQLRTAKIFF